jgi:hypothetical protein
MFVSGIPQRHPSYREQIPCYIGPAHIGDVTIVTVARPQPRQYLITGGSPSRQGLRF